MARPVYETTFEPLSGAVATYGEPWMPHLTLRDAPKIEALSAVTESATSLAPKTSLEADAPPEAAGHAMTEDTIAHYGTVVRDLMHIAEFAPTIVNTFGGDDRIFLYGDAEYSVKLGPGDDSLFLHSRGEIVADGGAGDDAFYVYHFAAHELHGGNGEDLISFSDLEHSININLAAREAYVGNDSAAKLTLVGFEQVNGTKFSDMIVGNSADNYIVGGLGNNQVFTGRGNDHYLGDRGNDYVELGEGDDRAEVFFGNNVVRGGAGDDLMSAIGGENDFFTGTGDDTVSGGNDNDWVFGGAAGDDGSDRFAGNDDSFLSYMKGDMLDYSLADAGVIIDTGAGTVSGEGAGVKVVQAGGTSSIEMMVDSFTGFELFQGSKFADVFRSGEGIDYEYFHGGQGDDLFHGTVGVKFFDGGSHDFKYSDVAGSEGFDLVSYAAFDGKIVADLEDGTGIATHQTLGSSEHSYEAIDGLIGSSGSDTLIGDDADNYLEGGKGSDRLTGREGNDTFAFKDSDGLSFYDIVTDFTRRDDVILLQGQSLQDGTVIEDFSDLDTTGNGWLTSADASFLSDGTRGFLMLESGVIALEGVTRVDVGDFDFG